jgi:AraC-like DNA-binding protein
VRPAADLLGLDDRPVAARILGGHDDAEMVAALEEYFLRTGPEPDPTGRRVTELVAEAERNPGITRAETLAAEAGMSLRSLQRLFAEYVGVGPKWVIQRFRILDAVAAAHSGAVTDWAALARELGFSDQAHLIRVFAHVVGTPPASYQREVGRD